MTAKTTRQESGWSPTQTRFIVTLSVLASMGIVALISQRLIISESILLRFFGILIVAILGFFGYEWVWVHSNALTRQKRAHFDEVNILETYQPRARSHGHLFQPDPPTPGPVVKFVDGGENSNETPAEKTAFNANRDAHYADMFNYAIRVAKEQEAMEKAQPQPDKSPVTTAKSSQSPKPNDKASNSTRTALPKEEAKGSPTKESPVASTQMEELVGDGNEKGGSEPLYENMNPVDDLPNAPRPSAVERLRESMGQVAQMVAKNVGSKVRTALENSSSFRGSAPSSLRSEPDDDKKKAIDENQNRK